MKSQLVNSVVNQLGYTNAALNIKSVKNGYIQEFKVTDSDLLSTCNDISNHGIDGGYGGFVYYSDTVAFYDKNKSLIIELAEETADSIGYSLSDSKTMSILEELENDNDADMKKVRKFLFNNFSSKAVAMVLNFGGWKNVGDLDQLKNLLAWFAGEEVARYLIND